MALLAIWSALSDASGSPVDAAVGGEEAGEPEDAGTEEGEEGEEGEAVELEDDEHAVMNRGTAAAVRAAAFMLERIGSPEEVGIHWAMTACQDLRIAKHM